eukprot:15462058-Alexandrium_andersonii.AAC.1
MARPHLPAQACPRAARAKGPRRNAARCEVPARGRDHAARRPRRRDGEAPGAERCPARSASPPKGGAWRVAQA